MRIDGTFGINPQPLSNGKVPSGDVKNRNEGEGQVDRVVLEEAQVEYLVKAYIEKASGVEELDKAAVEEARELLKSGAMDTPEALQRAAEAILRLGA